MSAPSAQSVDLTKLKSFYPFAAFIWVVTEGFFAAWLLAADTGAERIVAGVLILLTFVVFAYLTVTSKRSPRPSGAVVALGEDVRVNVADAAKSAPAHSSPGRLVGPDRSYTIQEPPLDEWQIRELTVEEWNAGGLGIADVSRIKSKSVKDLLAAGAGEREIMTFEARTTTEVIPVPGVTLVNGQKWPGTLSSDFPTRLAIVPYTRRQPPFYMEVPFLHNFYHFVGILLGTGFTLIESDKGTREDGRNYRWAKMRQIVANATINGVQGSSVEFDYLVVGVEGEIRDHFLLLTYANLEADARRAGHHRRFEVLQSLVESFKASPIVDPARQRAELKQRAEEEFERFIASQQLGMFQREFVSLIVRLSAIDLENLSEVARAIRWVEPFRDRAAQMDLKDEDLARLWPALDQAKAGDPRSFIACVQKFITQLDQTSASATPSTMGDPATVDGITADAGKEAIQGV